jgi:spore germination protein GerM
MTKTKYRLLAVLSLIALVSAGLAIYVYQRSGAPPAQRTSAVENEAVSVYFPGESGKLERKLVEVRRHLTDRARADALFRELKEARSIPDRLKLYELALGRDGVLYLNISREFIDRMGHEREITVIYSLVNSFIESFRDAKRVQLLIEGQPMYTRSGLLYVFEPLEFNKDVLEE